MVSIATVSNRYSQSINRTCGGFSVPGVVALSPVGDEGAESEEGVADGSNVRM